MESSRKKSKLLMQVTVLAIIITSTSCKITEKRVYGTWSGAFLSIELRTDNTFLITSSFPGSDGHKIEEKQYSGVWSMSNKSIFLNFEHPEDRKIFGGCKGVQISKILFFKMKLMRAKSCARDAMPDRPYFYVRVK